MAVTFVIGRAGSGKTARCFGRIREMLRVAPLGPPIFLIVPNQATFQVEREMMAGTGGFSRLVVVSFDLLGRQIATECGDAAVPEVTSLGRQLILGHLLRRHHAELSFFGGVAHQPGMAAELDATFAEFERAGKTDADLADLLDHLRHADPDGPGGPSLAAKLGDLRFLYDAYGKFLGQDRLDQHRRLTQALSQLANCSFVRGATVFVDDFYDFTEYERRFLSGLGLACDAVEINLTIDPRSPTVGNPRTVPVEMSLFHRTEEAYRRLRLAMDQAHVVTNEPVLLGDAHRFRSAELASVEREAFAPGRIPSSSRLSTPSAGTPGECGGAGLLFEGKPLPEASAEKCPHPNPPPEREKEECRERDQARCSPRAQGEPPERPQKEYPGNEQEEDRWRAPAESRGSKKNERDRSPAVGSGLGLVEAPDPRAEVDAAARGIVDLLRQGHRLRDVAVLARDLSPYQRLIDVSFPEHGLSYFVDRRRPAEHHPLLAFARAMLQIARDGWPMHAVMAFLKTGLAGVTLMEADEIENYLIQHRLGGAAWDDSAEWAFQRQMTSADDDGPPPEVFEVRGVGRIRRGIASRLVPLLDKVRRPGSFPLSELAAEIFQAFERFDVRGTLSAWAATAAEAGDNEQAGEHEQVWAEWVDLFEQMVDLLGGELVSFADFIDVVEWGLERFDLALTPPTVDQVLVGQVGRTRTPEVKAVFLLGMSEGQFPRPARDQTILSHSERRELRRRNVDLGPGSDRQRLDEHFLGYVAFTRASERLIVSRPLTDDAGKPAEPSPFWRRLGDLLPDVRPVPVPREAQVPRDIQRIATPRQLLGTLMQWAREEEKTTFNVDSPTPDPRADTRPDPRAALYQWIATRGQRDGAGNRIEPRDAIGLLRPLAWKALSYSNDAKLSPEIVTELFPTPLQASVAQVETFAACPFRHFMRYGIRVAGRDDPHVNALDMSQVYHDVLRSMAVAMLKRRQDWSDLPAESARRMIELFCDSVARQLRGEVMFSTARNKYLLARIERNLERVVASFGEMQSRGHFHPAEAGIGFGQSGLLPAYHVRTPAGKDLSLSGRIDRVDALDSENSSVPGVAVFDYKLSAGALSLGDLYYGLSLQLMTCLLVLRANGQQIVGKPLNPAAAFYYPLLRKIRQVEHPKEALDPSDPLFNLKPKPRGVFDERYFPDLDSQAAPGDSPVVQAYLKQDGQLGQRSKSDFVAAGEFTALMSHVHERLGQIGGQIMAGKIGVHPYRINRRTPCPTCEYRAICRFEPGPKSYRHLTPMGRQKALTVITEAAHGRDNGA